MKRGRGLKGKGRWGALSSRKQLAFYVPYNFLVFSSLVPVYVHFFQSIQPFFAIFEVPVLKPKNGVFTLSTHCSFLLSKTTKFHFVDAILFHFLKIDVISLCRRFSPEKHFVDAILQKNTWSTHFSRKTLGRRISPEKHFVDAFPQINTLSTHFSIKHFTFLHEKHFVDAFLP